VTWDEDDGTVVNHIPTIFYCQPVRPGRQRERITHYSVLRTIEAACGLRHDGHAATTRPITNVRKRPWHPACGEKGTGKSRQPEMSGGFRTLKGTEALKPRAGTAGPTLGRAWPFRFSGVGRAVGGGG